ncbi:MAG TPA: hypothetical protein VME43_33855 [Bryobacteraceae bacterium]|nr:hypothetical protein [Bryobacteraceae bacterium]
MGSTSMNPGVSDLLQTLSNLNSPVLSSPAVVSALENASPSDIVQLSAEASQLEGVDAMFGISDSSDGSDSSAGSLTSALASLESPAASSSSTSSSSTTSSATSSAAQLANYQAAVQSDETQALLDDGTGSGLTGSLFDYTG